MSILREPLRRLGLPKITSASAYKGETLGQWVAKGSYYVDSVSDSERFNLQVGNVDDLLPVFATSADRMLSACFETVLSITAESATSRSSAWLLLRLYYAAFYAAHALLRLAGQTCSQLDIAQATAVIESASAYGVAGDVQKINQGYYHVTFDWQSLSINFAHAGKNGSHELLWKCYSDLLANFVARAPQELLILQQSIQFVETLKQLRAVLCRNGLNGGNWLSYMRNTINYRHSHGVWFPYSQRKRSSSAMYEKLLSGFLADPDLPSLTLKAGSRDFDIELMYRATIFICSMAREIAIDLGSRALNPQSPFLSGSLVLLRRSKLTL